jgi:hypothetical protein
MPLLSLRGYSVSGMYVYVFTLHLLSIYFMQNQFFSDYNDVGDEVAKTTYKVFNVIYTKKAIVSLVLHIVRWC